jgi:amino acid adenylation domain-containing protein
VDRQRFEQFGRGAFQVPSQQVIHRAIGHWAATTPAAVAVEHGDEVLTYAQLDQQAEELARALQARGVGPGDHVAVFLRRSIPMAVGFLAVLKAGAAYVPQHVGVAPRTQLDDIVERTSARVVLTLDELRYDVPTPAGGGVVAIDDPTSWWPSRPAAVPAPAATTADDPCFVLFTSGTTGTPNGVVVTHGNVCNVLLTDPGRLGMGPGRRVAQILSIAFDMAEWETLGALMNGATLLIRGSDIQATAERADVLIATPSILGSLDPVRCRNVSVVAVAGEPCPRPLADTWSAFATFYNSCGPTETTIINTAQRYRPDGHGLTIGRPTPNNTVYILDDQLRPCPIGEVGEMWAGGACVTAGYLGDEELTGHRYRPDPFLGGGRRMFRTRDLGRWTSTGELEHHGRTDDQVKVRGFRVELGSVTAVLEQVPGCTAGVTLELDDRHLVSFVQPATVDPEAARRAVAGALPYYCVPAAVIPVAELPRTSRGKVDKAVLRREAASLGVAAAARLEVV